MDTSLGYASWVAIGIQMCALVCLYSLLLRTLIDSTQQIYRSQESETSLGCTSTSPIPVSTSYAILRLAVLAFLMLRGMQNKGLKL